MIYCYKDEYEYIFQGEQRKQREFFLTNNKPRLIVIVTLFLSSQITHTRISLVD